MSSEPKATLVIRPREQFTSVRVLDARLQPVTLPTADSFGCFELELPLGMYEVHFRSGDTTAIEVTMLQATDSRVEVTSSGDFKRTSSAPLFGTATTHEYHAYPAADLSREPARRLLGGGPCSLLIFVRDPVDERPGNRGQGLTLHDIDGTQILSLEHEGKHDAAARWAGAHVALPIGTYRMRITRSDDCQWEVPLIVRQGFQTQAFLVCRTSTQELPLADVATMTVLMAPLSFGYAPDSEDLRRTDAALSALTLNRSVTWSDASALLNGKFDNPMLGIYGAHLLLRDDASLHAELLVTVLKHLRNMLGAHPDVDALRLGLEHRLKRNPFGSTWPVEPLETLPMLHRSWKRWVEATERDPSLIPEGSIADLVSADAAATGAWLAWPSATAMSPPVRATGLRPALDAEEVFARLQDTLRAQPSLISASSVGSTMSMLQRQIALTLAPSIDSRMNDLATTNPRIAQLIEQSEFATRIPTALTARFHVPHGTAVRAASELLNSIEEHAVVDHELENDTFW